MDRKGFGEVMYIPLEFSDITRRTMTDKFEPGDKILWLGQSGTVEEKLGPASWLVKLDSDESGEAIPIYESEMVKHA